MCMVAPESILETSEAVPMPEHISPSEVALNSIEDPINAGPSKVVTARRATLGKPAAFTILRVDSCERITDKKCKKCQKVPLIECIVVPCFFSSGPSHIHTT